MLSKLTNQLPIQTSKPETTPTTVSPEPAITQSTCLEMNTDTEFAENTENYGRHLTIWITNLKESLEGRNLVLSLEKWLPKALRLPTENL